MSFLKITDSKKRDAIVNEFLKSKKNVQQSYISEKLGDIGLQRDLTKVFKPITETQKTLQQALQTDLGGIKENLQALPESLSTSLKAMLPAQSNVKVIEFPQYPSIEAYTDDPEKDVMASQAGVIGKVAKDYLLNYASKEKTDKTFGIRSENGRFYIGDTPITIQGNDVTVGNKTYPGTPGLWELLTMSEPDRAIWRNDDMDNYTEILTVTNAMSQPGNPNRPKSSKGYKWTVVVKHIWDAVKGTTSRGSTSVSPPPSPKRGIRPRASVSDSPPPTRSAKPSVGKGVIVIPQDPNALIELLSVRLASFKAGNTGVRNEIVSICDELLRQQQLNKTDYKKIMLLIKKDDNNKK